MLLTRDDVRTNISANIHDKLVEREWTVETLYEQVEKLVPRNTVYRIARGENAGAIHHLVAIGNVLNMTVDEMIQPLQKKKLAKSRR